MLLLTGCGPGKIFGPSVTSTPSVTPTLTPTSTLTPTNTPTPTPTLTPTPIGGVSGIIVFLREEIIDYVTINNIYSINLSTNIEINLTKNTDPSVNYYAPAVSPDSKRIVYSRDSGHNAELFIMNIDGTNITKISPVPAYKGNVNVSELLIDWQPSWSPDGDRITFSSNRHLLHNYYNDYEIYLIDLDTYEVKQLTNAYRYSQHPWFSPDGEKITFMSNKEDNWNIYIMNADGSNVQKITTGYSADRFPKWSNDGNSIVFHSDRDGSLDLFIYDINNKSTIKITDDPAINATAGFSPDNNWIIFQSDMSGNENLVILNLSTSERIQLTNNTYIDTNSDWEN